MKIILVLILDDAIVPDLSWPYMNVHVQVKNYFVDPKIHNFPNLSHHLTKYEDSFNSHDNSVDSSDSIL